MLFAENHPVDSHYHIMQPSEAELAETKSLCRSHTSAKPNDRRHLANVGDKIRGFHYRMYTAYFVANIR